ncbi:MAG: hypothetical protein K0M40_15160, partial [Prolixibacteraceae bacterium]|nr:hypothetical protein [Prolixibacteraceae bacterium]
PIRIGNPDVGVEMKPTGVADLNAGVRMKPIEQKMKPIRVGNPDVEVKMKPTGVKMKYAEQIFPERFLFFVEFAAKQYYICHWYTKKPTYRKNVD